MGEHDRADDIIPGRNRHTEPRLGQARPLGKDRPHLHGRLERVQPQRPLRSNDDRGEALTKLDRLGLETFAILDPVREVDHLRLRVVRCNEHVPRLLGEHRPQAFSDELDDRVEIELLRERLTDLVDDRQL